MPLIIRRAEPSDRRAMAHAIRGRKVSNKLDALIPLSIVADVDGDVVGFLAHQGPRLHGLYVRVDQRGKGVGSALLDHVERETEAAGGYGTRLYVEMRNLRARQLYVARGYVAVGRAGQRGQMLTMEKRFREPALDELMI